jgi:glycosyltransferase involved in cell wall biosynthesis
MPVSLLLATINRTTELSRLILSLLDQTSREFELIVLDQNRDDRLLPYIGMAREGGLDVRHERMDKPGLSAARNRGIELAKYDILAFPDDDCWYENNVIERVICSFRDHGAGGVVGHWVEQSGGEFLKAYQLDLAAWRRFRGGNASSISLFFNRSLFMSLGGFDERLGVGKWYGAAEETDIVLRALTRGARLYFRPDIRVHHNYSTQLSGELRTICAQARTRGRGTGAIYAKHKLETYVILRGLAGPIITAVPRLLRPRGYYSLLKGLYTSLGRLEGYVRWRLTE